MSTSLLVGLAEKNTKRSGEVAPGAQPDAKTITGRNYRLELPAYKESWKSWKATAAGSVGAQGLASDTEGEHDGTVIA